MTSPIASFYKNKSVFVTGGTGFVGKVLIEKLLYSCKDINSVFLHIKPKYGKKIDDRMNELLESTAFQRLHKENPAALKKIVPIAGDIGAERLGISSKDISMLQEQVSVVFHSAAKIKFNYDLAPSVDINTKGTQKVLDLCKGIKNFQSFIYVSTAYSNCPVKIIEEVIYKTGISLEHLYDILKTADVNTCKQIVGSRPNAYTLSKALSEELIDKEAREFDIPTTIIRPSFIMSSVKEPSPGYVDNWYCWNAIIAGGMSGVLRAMLCRPDVATGLIPVDHMANLCIAAAWDTHRRRESGDKKLKVFNASSGLNDFMTQKDLLRQSLRHAHSIVPHMGPKPTLLVTTDEKLFHISTFVMEKIPAFFAKIWESVTGEKSEYLSIYKRARAVADVCSVFLLIDYRFVDTNTKKLYKELEEHDKKEFDFNYNGIRWDQCLKDYVSGLNKYLLKK